MINMTKTLDIASTPQDAVLLDTLDETWSLGLGYGEGRAELNFCLSREGQDEYNDFTMTPAAWTPLIALHI